MKWKFYFLLLSVFLYLPFSAAAIDLSVNEILHYEYSKDGTEVNVWTKGTVIQKDRTILSPSREQISANTYSIYPGAKFYQEAGTWYEIERYTQDAETFTAPPSSFLGIKKAIADYVPVEGIFGCTRGTNANYSTAGSTGTAINPCANSTSLGDVSNTLGGSGNYFRTRLGLGFDVTGLTVSSSTLYILPSQVTNQSSDSLSVVVLTPNSYSVLASGDHTNFGTTKIANDRPLGQFAVGVLQGMAITDITAFTGVFAIGLRTAKDIADTAPGAGQYNDLAISNVYLEVETSGGSPTPTPGATATTTAADYERLSAFALTGAVSLLFFLVGFGLVVFIYKML